MEDDIRWINKSLPNIHSLAQLDGLIAKLKDDIQTSTRQLDELKESNRQADSFVNDKSLALQEEKRVLAADLEALEHSVGTHEASLFPQIADLAEMLQVKYEALRDLQLTERREKLEGLWKAFERALTTNFVLDPNGGFQGIDVSEFRAFSVSLCKQYRLLSAEEIIIIAKRLESITTLVSSLMVDLLERLKSLVWSSNIASQCFGRSSIFSNDALRELVLVFELALVCAQPSCLLLSQDFQAKLRTCMKIFLFPILKKFRYHFSNASQARPAASSSNQPEDNQMRVKSNWMFIYGLNWISENHAFFITQDLPALQKNCLFEEVESDCLLLCYVDIFGDLFGDLSLVNVENKNDWIIAEYLVDALKFDFLFNQTFPTKHETGLMSVFGKVCQRQPQFADRWFNVEKYKLLAYLHDEIFNERTAFSTCLDAIIPPKYASIDRDTSKLDHLLQDLCRDIDCPFYCVQQTTTFIEEYVTEEIGFLLPLGHRHLYEDRFLQELVVTEFLGSFLKYLEGAIRDMRMSEEFTQKALISVRYLKTWSSQYLSSIEANDASRLLRADLDALEDQARDNLEALQHGTTTVAGFGVLRSIESQIENLIEL